MAKIWISYAWADNNNQDVDFVAQELERAGLSVKLDRWNIGAGRRLWEQIETHICDPEQSDAWLLIATQNSLASEPCKEEFAYALERALKSRGGGFPVIALFLTHTDSSLIPAGIRTRLFVSITDPDWKERIVAAAEGRDHAASRPEVEPYSIRLHTIPGHPRPFVIEVRPRAGVWAPFIAGIPMAERDRVQPSIMVGPRDVPTDTGVLFMSGEEPSADSSMWYMTASNQCTPTESYYIWCVNLPTELLFGVNSRQPQFKVTIRQG
jgi:hypothetical protein